MSLLADRARCLHCGGRTFLEPDPPETEINDHWVYRCLNCSRSRKETDDEVFARTGMEARRVLRDRMAKEIRWEQDEKRRRRRRKVRIVETAIG